MSNRTGPAPGGPLAASLLAAALAFSFVPAASAGDEEGCLGCHGLEGFASRPGGGRVRPLAISAERFSASVHGPLGCRDCHADISSIPHPEAAADVNCGQPCHVGAGKEGKEYSHEALYWEYTASVHGSQKTRKVACLVCHPAPAVAADPDQRRDKMQEVRQCAACHRESPKVLAWFDDVHFLALARGNRLAPSCPDCHTDHRVWPPAAKESSVNARRLADTCGKGAIPGGTRGCHAGAGEGAVRGAGMNLLPLGRHDRPARPGLATLLFGLMLAGLAARAGLGFLRRR
jgi:hypothetical protein